MGEGEESLEEMLDLFPEGQDEHRPAQTRRIHISGADERACASFAEQESQQHFAMHQVMPDLDQMLGGPDQDGDVFGVLANNSSSGWDAAQQSPEAPSRALPSVTAWDDFPAVQESGNTCDASSDGSPHPNALRSSDRSPGKSILAAGQAVEARHLGDEQADDTDAKRTSSRKRSTTSRFDPVKDGAHPRRGGGHKRVKLKDGSGNLERSEMVGASIAPVSKRKRKVKTPPSHEAHAPTEASSTKITSAMGRPGRPRNRAQDLGLERGKHVARKPEMQKTARAGQKRWKELLVKMRAELEESPTSAAFGRQLSEVCVCACVHSRV
jgi:hypothetical protein